MIQQHQCAINACNVRQTPVMVEKTTIRPGITMLPMGHYRRVYNGSPIVHNRFSDGRVRRGRDVLILVVLFSALVDF